MKKIHRFIFAICLAAPFHAVHAQQGFVGVKGKEIVDGAGKPLLIKGINLGNWLLPEGYMFKFSKTSSPRLIDQVLQELVGPSETKAFWQQYMDRYITEKDISYLRSIGCNSIRLPFHYKLFVNEYYLGATDSSRGFRYMDKVIGWCRNAGITVLLDMHCAPAGQTGDNIDDSYGYPYLYTDSAAQQQTIAIWERIARRYSKEPVVMGYDLLNEPIAHYFNKQELNPLLEPLYKRITAAIRKADKNHLVFLEGAQWASDFKSFGKPFDNKLVYSFHKYWTDTTLKVIQEYIDFRDKYKVPVYVGETGENTNQWNAAFRRLLEANNIGWHYWTYKKMKSDRSFAEFDQPAGYDTLIAYAEGDRSGFKQMRERRPKDIRAIQEILQAIADNCLFDKCRINKGFISAVGLKEEAAR
jgi:endoglucanase